MAKRFHAIVVGKVQGVFYRATARQKAVELGIKGFIRNLPDGSVELDAEGDEAEVEAFLQWCRKGPPAARVEDVQFEWKVPENRHHEFRVSY